MSLINFELQCWENSDQDLVQIAGYHAYLDIDELLEFEVNGTEYEVLEKISDTTTGLDAITIVNTVNQEVTIAYIGTDPNQIQDIITDIKLLSDLEVSQLMEARKYFEKMDAKYGVSSITGNSLGGALAAAVAIENPDIRAVTLNPALLPDNMLDPSETYDHITNYFSTYDVLTNTLTALELDSRIPGQHYEIYNGIPNGFDKIGPNHTGYVRRPDGQQIYQIREEGEPGAGVIYIGADDHIVTSIWTGLPIYGERSGRIEITPENLRILSKGLKTSVIEELDLVDRYLAHAIEIVEDEGEKYTRRLLRLQYKFEELIEQGCNHKFFCNISSTGDLAHQEIDRLLDLLDQSKEKSDQASDLLLFPPDQLSQFLSGGGLDLTSDYQKVDADLQEFNEQVDQLVISFNTLLTDTLVEIFEGKIASQKDAVVDQLNDHYYSVRDNCKQIKGQIKLLADQVQETADSFEQCDLQLAVSIFYQTQISRDLRLITPLDPYRMKRSDDIPSHIPLKEAQLELAFNNFSEKSTLILIPIIRGLRRLAGSINVTLTLITGSLRVGTNLLLYGGIPGLLMHVFRDYDDCLRCRVNQALEPLDELSSTIKGIRRGLIQLEDNFPELLEQFRPYLAHAIFAEDDYADVYAYNQAIISKLKEIQLVFADIIEQLKENQAQSIIELTLNSARVKSHIEALETQLEQVTLF